MVTGMNSAVGQLEILTVDRLWLKIMTLILQEWLTDLQSIGRTVQNSLSKVKLLLLQAWLWLPMEMYMLQGIAMKFLTLPYVGRMVRELFWERVKVTPMQPTFFYMRMMFTY